MPIATNVFMAQECRRLGESSRTEDPSEGESAERFRGVSLDDNRPDHAGVEIRGVDRAPVSVGADD